VIGLSVVAAFLMGGVFVIPGSPVLLDRRYRIQSILFVGEHERCYAARHVELDLPVCITALRVPACHAATSLDSMRFWTLAQQAASLRHPAFPRVRDCFAASDDVVLVEDPIAGETLADRLRREGPLSLREALALGLRLCDALAHAGQAAAELLPFITITPRALVFLPSGQIVLADLGVRRWLGLPSAAPQAEMAAYRAPELAHNTVPDVRANVYSVAAVVYHAVSGHQPVPWTHTASPLDALEPSIPAALSQVIEHALAADPDLRYAGAERLGRALAMAARLSLPETAALAASSPPRKRTKVAAILAARAQAAPLLPRGVTAPAHPGLLSRPAQLASELVRLSILWPFRRDARHKGAIAGSPAHSGA
jgi:hypothetical protein